mmetsp:Transcript_34880/g.76117  ORF Transcript_34880/g.76117 Transcript_34880/m.76117 type:complete len:382 (-) Transcript_34880:88-1233(-)
MRVPSVLPVAAGPSRSAVGSSAPRSERPGFAVGQRAVLADAASASLLGVPLAFVASALGGGACRRLRFQRRSRATALLRRAAPAVPTQQFSQEVRDGAIMRDEMVQSSIEAATPVPQSFSQAVTWACSAALQAAEAGNSRQTMFFNAGGKTKDVNGEIGGVLAFAEQFATLLVGAEPLEGGKVRVIFSDMGAASMARVRWEPLPEGLELDYFPQVIQGQDATTEMKMQLRDMLDAAFLVVVAPKQAETPALLQLFKVMGEAGRDIPVVIMNQNCVQDTAIAASSMLRAFGSLRKTLVPTFHLEQHEPPEDDDDMLNPCVVARVWPRPYSVWEDNPDDPDAIDGYFLLDLNDVEAPDSEEIEELMRFSRNATRTLAESRSQA